MFVVSHKCSLLLVNCVNSSSGLVLINKRASHAMTQIGGYKESALRSPFQYYRSKYGSYGHGLTLEHCD